MSLVVVLVVAACLAVALGAYVLFAARRTPLAVAVGPRRDDDDGIVSEPVPIERSVQPGVEPAAAAPVTGTVQAQSTAPALVPDAAPAEPAAGICWAKRFAPRDGALDDATRLGLIHDLGLVRAPWGVPLLVQAYDEEPDAAHRRAVLAALALYRHLDARAVFERALRSADDGERAIAGAALVDLGLTVPLPS